MMRKKRRFSYILVFFLFSVLHKINTGRLRPYTEQDFQEPVREKEVQKAEEQERELRQIEPEIP